MICVRTLTGVAIVLATFVVLPLLIGYALSH